MTAPTTAPGLVDSSSQFAGWAAVFGDMFEVIPDLLHPTSVLTYAQMRRDPQLTAILSALTLPVRRATWQIDPTGCRPEVVAVVADDLGLPVAGQDRTPTGARVRGVKWRDHLRVALLREVFGYLPFAHRYEIRGGQARLVALAERMPQTWAEVATDNDGALVSATQNVTEGHAQPKPIPAGHLTWHVREREGGNWWGTSVLRSSYAPWLLKREMQRVLATGNRRFSMGVPTMKALPGTTPTPGQMQAAQAAVSAARAGDQAGMAVPPGFQLELLGIVGSTPDTLGFLKWLDQQMSRTALAGFLDLGETSNGSRALGAEFVDLFLLVEQTLADDIAATETEQTVARLVEWNWGADEPVPAVVAADVGSRREVTAEALQMLLSSGALAADPELESWVRREWRLPARIAAGEQPSSPIFAYDLQYQTATVNERRAQLGLDPLPGGDTFAVPPAAPAAPAMQPAARAKTARQRAAKPATAAGDDPVSVLRRQPTLVEAAAGTDFEQLQAQWAEALAQLVADFDGVTADQRAELLGQIAAAVGDGQIDALAELAVNSEAAAELLAARMHDLADQAAAAQAAEAKSQGVTVPKAKPDGDRLGQIATALAGIAAGALAVSAGKKAVQAWTTDASAADVTGAVTEYLDGLTGASLTDTLGGALSAAQNEGRMSVLRAAPPATYYASEVLDKATCKNCQAVDGQQFEGLPDAEQAYASGGYRECLGGLRCRGIVVTVWG